jgi:hypothetical protein
VALKIITPVKEKLIKIGAKVVSYARYVAFEMEQVAIPRNLFADILLSIAELRPPPIASRRSAFGCLGLIENDGKGVPQ